MEETQNHILFHKVFQLEGGNFPSAGTISDQVKKTLKRAGFPNQIIRRVSIATFEAEMNVICYAKRGELSLTITPTSLKVVVEDEGKGIMDIDLAMREGYSTADERIRELGFGAGMGLPNIKKNTDEMILTSKFRQGTHLEFTIYLERQENTLPFE
jgi:anti-sigma regulatory factor (Ser/Thr protein kinase)